LYVGESTKSKHKEISEIRETLTEVQEVTGKTLGRRGKSRTQITGNAKAVYAQCKKKKKKDAQNMSK
jgi:hypothetical protein